MNGKPIQCMCGWWPPKTPQHLWTKQELESVVAHQQAHIQEQERLFPTQQQTKHTIYPNAGGPGSENG